MIFLVKRKDRIFAEDFRLNFSLNYLVRISSTNVGQVEIDLNKKTNQIWKSIGIFQSHHLSICPMRNFGMY